MLMSHQNNEAESTKKSGSKSTPKPLESHLTNPPAVENHPAPLTLPLLQWVQITPNNHQSLFQQIYQPMKLSETLTKPLRSLRMGSSPNLKLLHSSPHIMFFSLPYFYSISFFHHYLITLLQGHMAIHAAALWLILFLSLTCVLLYLWLTALLLDMTHTLMTHCPGI